MFGTGTKKRNLQNRAVFVLRVGRITTFDQYWSNSEFAAKRAVMNGSRVQRYGDNIYHHDPATQAWLQEDSFHSREGGVLDNDNLITDTGHTDRVLIADWFIYWGGDGPVIPPELSYAIHTTQGHRTVDDQAKIEAIINWAKNVSSEAKIGEPAEWRFIQDRKDNRCHY